MEWVQGEDRVVFVTPNLDISALEKQVDQKVYELYGLSDEDVRTEEGNGNIFYVMV